MVEATNPDLILLKCKAINALLPYAIYLAQDGQCEMIDMVSHAASALNSGEFMWHCIGPYITALFDKPTIPSLNWVFTLASPHIPWHDQPHDKNAVTRWATAALEIPYTEAIGQSVVYALLQIASVESLQPHIPIAIWAWLKKQPGLPHGYTRQLTWAKANVVHCVRLLGNIDILKSYLLLVWSNPHGVDVQFGGVNEMQVSIQEDFNGIGMVHHREDLIRRLDHTLRQIPSTSNLWDDELVRRQYRGLKAVLLRVDGEAMNILTRMPFKLIIFSLLTLIDTYRIAFDLRVRSASPMPMISRLGNVARLPPTGHFICTITSSCCYHLPRIALVTFVSLYS